MPSKSRKQRASETQTLVANYLSEHGWPYATAVGAGRGGRDILYVDGYAIEVKARRDWSPTAWIRQALGHATDGELSLTIQRPDGFGPASIEDWPVILRLADATKLMRHAYALAQVQDALMDRDDLEEVQVFIRKVLAGDAVPEQLKLELEL